MLFNSLTFLVFVAIFFPAYFVLHGRARLWLILVASYIFYGWWNWRFLGLIGLSTVMDYSIGRLIDRQTNKANRKSLLIVSVAVNLGFLGIFKYFNFFADSFAVLAQSVGITPSWTTLHIVLPVGISFYTFQTLSYTIDVYRGACPVERNFLRFACFVAVFPQLIAGPIVRAAHFLPQLRVDHRFDTERVLRGLELIVWGYFLKLVLADTIGHQLVSDGSFEFPERFSGFGHLIAAVLFAFQIYGDFAGYSLIAIGLARIMGFDLGVNFRRPYFSATFSEFWQRWHISLSTWLRDYLYIPLGGSRYGAVKTARNLIITMFLGGLWHGASWTFVLWGLLHGLYLVIWHTGEQLAKRISSVRAWTWARLPLVLAVFFLTTIAWVLFRSHSLSTASDVIRRIITIDHSSTILTHDQFGLVKCLFVILFVLVVDSGAEIESIQTAYARSPVLRAGGMLVSLWTIAFLGTFSGTEFIYFQF
jgi:alginate O-acetyltransferase complex protein AlgI